MKYTYFPGCSLKGTGRAYEESLLAIFQKLGVSIQELSDWNCCGATTYMSVDENKAFTLAARNLVMAEVEPSDLMAPCSGCYLVLQKTKNYIQQYPDIHDYVCGALTSEHMDYKGTVNVRHPLDILVNDIGLEEIKKHVINPLTHIKVAPYYGCQIVRPFSTFDNQDAPETLDRLLRTIGAVVVPYPLKTRCCGGSLTGTLPKVGERLAYILLEEAKRQGADMIATVCPLCHFNLDSYQDEISERYSSVFMPTVYFTQLIGLALGLSQKALGLHRNIVPVDSILSQRPMNVVRA